MGKASGSADLADYQPPDYNSWDEDKKRAWVRILKAGITEEAAPLNELEKARLAKAEKAAAAAAGPPPPPPPPLLKPGEKNRDVVMRSVQYDGLSLRFADPKLLVDRELVLAAVGQNGDALAFAPAELRADREVVLTAVCQSGFALGFAPTEHCADRDLVMAAVQLDGAALGFASEALRQDREVVLAAVRQDGFALKCVNRHGCLTHGQCTSSPCTLHTVSPQ